MNRIEAEDNLAKLFNAYMGKLHTIETVVTPMYSMGEYISLMKQATQPEQTTEFEQTFNYCMPRFYHMVILGEALRGIHNDVTSALGCLIQLLDTCEGDLKRYAIEKRMASLEEFGGGEDDDWAEDGLDEAGEQKWRVVFKEDEKTLDEYHFKNDLREYFSGASWRGEHIGSSNAEDFATFSMHVLEATKFDVFKGMREATGHELPTYRPDENGNMVKQTLADEIEAEINEDIRNRSIVAYFNQVLNACNHAAALEAFATTAEHYEELRQLLQRILDVDLGDAHLIGFPGCAA
ncbi:hypothetical protein [Hymenobacter fodinae]|nr:hypothetical protein [Hymenobacter fodinae]